MTDFLMFLLAVLSFIIIGYPLTYLLIVKKRGDAFNAQSYVSYLKEYGKIFTIITSMYIGMIICSMYLIILSFAGVIFNISWIYYFSGAFLLADIIILIISRKKFKKSSRSSLYSISDAKFLVFEKKEDDGRVKTFGLKVREVVKDKRFVTTASIVLVVLIALNVAVSIFFAVLYPVRFWDAISCYSLKAKAFFIDGSIMPFYAEHGHGFAFLSYPIHFSLVQTWIYTWMGNLNENMLKVIFPVISMSLCYVLFFLFFKKLNRVLSLALVFIFSALPIVVDHGYIEYPNLLFSLLLLLGVYFFYRYCSTEKFELFKYKKLALSYDRSTFLYVGRKYPQQANANELMMAVIFFSFLASIRPEGMFYLGLFILLNALMHITNYYKVHKINKPFKIKSQGSYIKNIAAGVLLPPLLSFLLYLPWLLVMIRFNTGFWGPDWERSAQAGISFNTEGLLISIKSFTLEFIFSNFDSTRAFLGSSYGILWVLLAVLFFVNIKKMFARYSYIYLLFILFNFITVIISTVYVREFTGSLERYILASAPLAYYYVLSNSFKNKKEAGPNTLDLNENLNKSRKY